MLLLNYIDNVKICIQEKIINHCLYDYYRLFVIIHHFLIFKLNKMKAVSFNFY